MVQTLTGFQRAALRRAAHHLEPVVMVGRAGATEDVARHASRELDNHELIKVRFTDHKDERRALSEALSADLEATLVGVIGNVAILYRRARDPERRRIVVPGMS